jgi:hypothetical protein
MMVITKMLPKHLRITSVGFASCFAGIGGSLFPFVFGANIAAKGVKTLPAYIIALVSTLLVNWMSLPSLQCS